MAARRFLVPLDLSKNELQNAVVQNLGSAPGSPVKGQLYFDTASNVLNWWDGTAWQSAKGGAVAFGTITAEQTYGAAKADGVATTAARSDHGHGNPSLSGNTPTTAAVGDAAVVGVGTTPSHDDHKHGMPAFGAVTAQTAFGAASANGSATTLPHSDHVHGTPTHLPADHTTIPLSTFAAATATVQAGGQLISNVATPVAATDAANKGYVDGAVTGLSWKSAVRVATTVAGTLASSFANGQVVDGVTLVTGDRILIKNQAAGAENGIYVVAASGAPTRATDNDTAAEFLDAACFVQQGTTNADTGWVCTTDAPITVGTTATVWVQFTGAQSIVAGAGLTSTGNTLNVIGDTTMNVQADVLGVNRTAANGRIPILYAVTIGDGASTAITVTHNLGVSNSGTDLIVQVYDASTRVQVECDVVGATTNTVTLNFAVAPASNALRAVCFG